MTLSSWLQVFVVKEQVLALSGCDYLTISPNLLKELEAQTNTLTRQLHKDSLTDKNRPAPLSEVDFRWELNADAMATEKLAEGIRSFDRDLHTLKKLLEKQLV